MNGFDELFQPKPVDPRAIFNLRDDLAQWLIDELKNDWRTNSGDTGDHFEQGVSDLAERLITEWNVMK